MSDDAHELAPDAFDGWRPAATDVDGGRYSFVKRRHPPPHYNPPPKFGLRVRTLAYDEMPLGFLDILQSRSYAFDIRDPDSEIFALEKTTEPSALMGSYNLGTDE